MANKTIYVKDENVELFEKAEQLSGKKFSDLVAELVKEYVMSKHEEGDLYAICILDCTADNIPTFTPSYFIKAPVGTGIQVINGFVEQRILEGEADSDAQIVYPLLHIGGEFEEELRAAYLEGDLEVIELREE